MKEKKLPIKIKESKIVVVKNAMNESLVGVLTAETSNEVIRKINELIDYLESEQ